MTHQIWGKNACLHETVTSSADSRTTRHFRIKSSVAAAAEEGTDTKKTLEVSAPVATVWSVLFPPPPPPRFGDCEKNSTQYFFFRWKSATFSVFPYTVVYKVVALLDSLSLLWWQCYITFSSPKNIRQMKKERSGDRVSRPRFSGSFGVNKKISPMGIFGHKKRRQKKWGQIMIAKKSFVGFFAGTTFFCFHRTKPRQVPKLVHGLREGERILPNLCCYPEKT